MSDEPQTISELSKEIADEVVSEKEKIEEIKSSKAATPANLSGDFKELTAFHRYVTAIKSNTFYPEAVKIALWRDPVKSGLLFGIFNFFFFLYNFGDFSLVTIFSYLLLTLLSICLGYSNYIVLKASWLQGKPVENPFIERFKDVKIQVTRESVDKHVTTLLDLVNTTINLFREVFYCTDNFLSGRFVLYFYIGATIGNWFSGATLIYLATLFVFVWPRLYEEKKKEIDQFHGIVKTEATKYFNLALSKLPPVVTDRFNNLKQKKN